MRCKDRKLDLSKIATSVVKELREAHPDRGVAVDIQEGMTAFADKKLILVALSNLLGNAWKFTSKTENARIEFGTIERDGKTVYMVKDNGAGFDQTVIPQSCSCLSSDCTRNRSSRERGSAWQSSSG